QGREATAPRARRASRTTPSRTSSAAAREPWRALAAERVLIGAPADATTFTAAADAELTAARPLPHNGYKVALMRNLVVAELTRLTEESAR
ncbi:hypothetical protein ACWC19_32160, partial [Streptomyces sp. 900105245]